MNAEVTESTPVETHVLVVDDVEENLLAMQALLARPGIRVITAASGMQALELLLTHDVALALLDVQMPEMDGFALAELMRGAQRTAGVPIIFLTAAGEDQQRTFRGYEAGAVDFLRKPIEPHMLRSKVAVFVELHQQRCQLMTRMSELERAVKLNETMAAVLAHDLRTPLSAIMMSAELVKRHGGADAVVQAGSRIKSSASRMARMIEQLLDFSRIRLELLRMDPAPANLQSVCDGAIAEVRQAAPDADIRFEPRGDLNGVFDHDRMMQVLINLIGNAVLHGESARRIDVLADGTGADRLSVRVRNEGLLPDEVKTHLFTPFRDTPRKESPGLGLGLYIVDQFVRAHGGMVAAHSSPSEGTVFEFHMPRHASGPRPEG
jgi:signal transduction histidine kinase